MSLMSDMATHPSKESNSLSRARSTLEADKMTGVLPRRLSHPDMLDRILSFATKPTLAKVMRVSHAFYDIAGPSVDKRLRADIHAAQNPCFGISMGTTVEKRASTIARRHCSNMFRSRASRMPTRISRMATRNRSRS